MGLLCVALKVIVPANQVAVLCFVDLLYYVCEIVLLKSFRWPRSASSPALVS